MQEILLLGCKLRLQHSVLDIMLTLSSQTLGFYTFVDASILPELECPGTALSS